MGCITIDYTNLMLNGKETKIKITTDEIPYMYYLQTKLSLTFVNRGLTQLSAASWNFSPSRKSRGIRCRTGKMHKFRFTDSQVYAMLTTNTCRESRVQDKTRHVHVNGIIFVSLGSLVVNTRRGRKGMTKNMKLQFNVVYQFTLTADDQAYFSLSELYNALKRSTSSAEY